MKWKIAIVGAGNMAAAHLDVLQAMEDVDVVGIYSRTHWKAVALAKMYNIGVVAETLSSLYELTAADGCIIAVSETATLDVCEEAFQFRWKLLIEKPVGLNLQDSDHVYCVAQAANAQAYVALNRRCLGSVRDAITLVSSDDATPRVISIQDQEAPSLARAAGRDERVVMNWHFANSVHLIDLFNVFARGQVVKVHNIIPHDGSERFVTHSVIEFSSGDMGIYHSIWDAPGPWSVTIETEQKRLSLEPIETLTTQTFPSRQREVIPTHDQDTDYKPGFYLQIKEFLSVINGDDAQLCSLNEYMKTVYLLDALYSADKDPIVKRVF